MKGAITRRLFPREKLARKSERLFLSVKSWNLANNICFKYLKRGYTSDNVLEFLDHFYSTYLYVWYKKNILIIIMYFISKNMINEYYISLQTAYTMMAITRQRFDMYQMLLNCKIVAQILIASDINAKCRIKWNIYNYKIVIHILFVKCIKYYGNVSGTADGTCMVLFYVVYV